MSQAGARGVTWAGLREAQAEEVRQAEAAAATSAERRQHMELRTAERAARLHHRCADDRGRTWQRNHMSASLSEIRLRECSQPV